MVEIRNDVIKLLVIAIIIDNDIRIIELLLIIDWFVLLLLYLLNLLLSEISLHLRLIFNPTS